MSPDVPGCASPHLRLRHHVAAPWSVPSLGLHMRTPVSRSGPALPQRDPILTSYVGSSPISKPGHRSEARTSHLFWGHNSMPDTSRGGLILAPPQAWLGYPGTTSARRRPQTRGTQTPRAAGPRGRVTHGSSVLDSRPSG
uniref:Uncharacterized protein n=1 Tax=Myotis myotis TaxID=51298 RepID=A0A7J7ZY21_MYOMY|nr:hypothetical protein mMyoMyo1_009982 [Myotis myotis]